MNKELERWQAEIVRDMLIEEYDAEVRRRYRRRLWNDAGELLGGIAVLALFTLLLWLYLLATPDQTSAECEALRAEMEAAEAN